MTDTPSADWIFVIDTEDYAGNFERALCGYLTGRIGECEVGVKEATAFMEETGMEPFDNVIDEPDDHGCRRPVTIYPTAGVKGEPYQSVAISFETEPSADQIALMKERAYQFAALLGRTYGDEPARPRISKITGFRLIKQTITRTLDSRAV